jgi:hypothetical protein
MPPVSRVGGAPNGNRESASARAKIDVRELMHGLAPGTPLAVFLHMLYNRIHAPDLR